MEENTVQNQQFYCQNSPISYVHRQFNDRYITSFIINVYFRWHFSRLNCPLRYKLKFSCKDLSVCYKFYTTCMSVPHRCLVQSAPKYWHQKVRKNGMGLHQWRVHSRIKKGWGLILQLHWVPFNALTQLGGQHEGHPACKNIFVCSQRFLLEGTWSNLGQPTKEGLKMKKNSVSACGLEKVFRFLYDSL